MAHRLLELVAAAGVAEADHGALVEGERIRRDRLSRPRAGLVHGVLEAELVHLVLLPLPEGEADSPAGERRGWAAPPHGFARPPPRGAPAGASRPLPSGEVRDAPKRRSRPRAHRAVGRSPPAEVQDRDRSAAPGLARTDFRAPVPDVHPQSQGKRPLARGSARGLAGGTRVEMAPLTG